ncbi:MAG TPA: cytochrome C oxidase Cbb3 [Polyangiaceae bacterium]|nr:cytochrome C oxidase Cbb3 [Polyangiaceae bacterium]
MRRGAALVLALFVLFATIDCRRGAATLGRDRSASLRPADAARGREVVVKFECTRCHAIEGVAAPAKDKQCTGCHEDVARGRVQGTPAQLARWQPKVAELGDVPSLLAVGSRFERDWIRRFLLQPYDLRPALAPTMPRLPLTEEHAADVAAFLSDASSELSLGSSVRTKSPLEGSGADDTASVLAGSDAARGRELMSVRGCGLCHRMSGTRPLAGALLPAQVAADMQRAVRLAPDLRYTRDRWRAAQLVRWLRDPPSVKRDTLMPNMGLDESEAKSVALYVLTTTLGPTEDPPASARLAILDRAVTYDEVASRVFRKTCWHCHGEPDFERGDGGPGNSGGFGFKGRRLNLSDYESTFAGYVDDAGRRSSLFAPVADGTPYVVAAMLARQSEERGQRGAMRGMPLGLPSASPEDIQLVETWISQGRRR